MSPHPAIATALADQHRRDLTARAVDLEACGWPAPPRGSGPPPGARAADHADIIRQLVTALRRTAMRLPVIKVPAAPL